MFLSVRPTQAKGWKGSSSCRTKYTELQPDPAGAPECKLSKNSGKEEGWVRMGVDGGYRYRKGVPCTYLLNSGNEIWEWHFVCVFKDHIDITASKCEFLYISPRGNINPRAEIRWARGWRSSRGSQLPLSTPSLWGALLYSAEEGDPSLLLQTHFYPCPLLPSLWFARYTSVDGVDWGTVQSIVIMSWRVCRSLETPDDDDIVKLMWVLRRYVVV